MNQQRIVDTAYDLNPEKSLIHGTRLVDWKLCPDKQANFDWKSQKDIIKSSSIHFTYESAIISKARVITRCPYSKVLLIPWLIQPQWHCQETHFNFFSHKHKNVFLTVGLWKLFANRNGASNESCTWKTDWFSNHSLELFHGSFFF